MARYFTKWRPKDGSSVASFQLDIDLILKFGLFKDSLCELCAEIVKAVGESKQE